MQRLSRLLRDQPERGASAVIVAIVMLVLIGFAGLGVDVTSAYARSQEVQNAADAAALAAAQECAQGDLDCSVGAPPLVRAMAERLAGENVRTPVEDVVVDPDGNQVTVRVTAQHENFFAGAFGVETFTVVRAATAQWEAPQAGPAMLPLTVSGCNFYDSAGAPVLNQNVQVWLPKGKDLFTTIDCGVLNYPPGGFGWLVHTDCQANINVGAEVLGDNGANRPEGCVAEALKINDVFLLPIFGSYRGQGSNAWYTIERFAALQLLGYHFSEGGPTVQDGVKCPGSAPKKSDYRDSCLNVRFVEWVDIGDDYTGDDAESETSIVRLIDPDHENSN
ncbi:pilus assembly protein TadG-related protein [Ornithinimicrobium sufpigmenti]|uniref:pilus assembly protein TadG-related protein n=1 Tax=Ornithinimicrobium sufpigmenti TaxID=2508882 RepID=UPI001036CA48|nr:MULTISPECIES: pilus assembly protein TadG-related protein [unclassified Ornithinimicrobium]